MISGAHPRLPSSPISLRSSPPAADRPELRPAPLGMFLPEFLNLLNIPLDKAGFLFGFFPFASLSSAFFEERDDASLLRVLRNVTRKVDTNRPRFSEGWQQNPCCRTSRKATLEGMHLGRTYLGGVSRRSHPYGRRSQRGQSLSRSPRRSPSLRGLRQFEIMPVIFSLNASDARSRHS